MYFLEHSDDGSHWLPAAEHENYNRLLRRWVYEASRENRAQWERIRGPHGPVSLFVSGRSIQNPALQNPFVSLHNAEEAGEIWARAWDS